MNRRRSTSGPAVAVALLCWTSCGAAERPNVLLIYTDDQGTVDAHCYGAEDLATPAQDRLAATGVRFTQMYAPSAICSASRAGLMTGRYPPRAGVPGNVSSEKGRPGMPTEEVTLAEVLKSSGYATGHVGKWHLGYTPPTMPNGQGFDDSFGHMGGCIDNYSHYFYWQGPNRHDLWRNGSEVRKEGQYFPDLMVAECKRFIEGNRSQPFFLYWALNIPHYPMQGTAKWRQHYREMEAPRRMYAALLSTMDERIGEVLDFLDSHGLRENTIVICQSDHGHSTEERAFFGGGSAGPYRGAKGCLFEGGIRAPSFISWPAKVPQGEVRNQMAHGCDWLPTIADLCGVPQPEHHLDGKSLKPVILDDAESPHAELFWLLGGGRNPQMALREGAWKLLVNPQDRSGQGELTEEDRVFLADLETDPAESTNLATRHSDVARRMKERIDALQEEVTSPR